MTDADPSEVGAAKEVCLRLLTGQMRTRAELAAKLDRRSYSPETTAAALDRLTEVGLIDDAAFAEAFVRTKHRERGLGRAALLVELRRKGVAKHIAEDAVAQIGDRDERARAEELVARKLDSAILGGLTGARRKLLAMLARRGYGASVAIDVVNQALNGYVDPAEMPFDDF